MGLAHLLTLLILLPTLFRVMGSVSNSSQFPMIPLGLKNHTVNSRKNIILHESRLAENLGVSSA
jgi:hypothetical protein